MTPDVPFHSTVRVWPVVAAFAALAGWYFAGLLHRRGASSAAANVSLHAVRLTLAWAFWLMAIRVVTAAVETAGTWSHGLMALAAAIASEVVLNAYGSVDKAATGRDRLVRTLLPRLRVGVIGLLTVLLLEPVVSQHVDRESERVVAVLVDDSESMGLSSRSASDGGATRREVARRLLAGEQGKGLLSRLAGDYRVRFYHFAATARPVEPGAWLNRSAVGTPTDRWAATTDFASALKQVEGDLPLDDLSGVILVTDGCDHTVGNPQHSVQSLARKRVPVSSVVIGSQAAVRDAEVVAVEVPMQVFLGDGVAVRSILRIDQCKGLSARVELLKDGQSVESRTIAVTSDRHRETVLFRHQPADVGVHQYTVRIEALPGEATVANNGVDQFVTVTKDHIRLLVIDERPRWEFRYLRNLFRGRDRTVHLQSVLLRPDRLVGVAAPPVLHASALRAFDDCEATALPATPEDWLKFDVIVLGDVPPERLGPAGLKAVETFVRHRGGSLIVIAGTEAMPHKYADTALADLFPVRLDRGQDVAAAGPDQEFHFVPARDGRSQAVMQQVGASMEALALAFPTLSWRHGACDAKAGATVLAYASRQPGGALGEDPRHNALMLWQRFGAGKVLQLTFDQSWRLRFGVGDTHHHQFWGQIVRWAVQDRLRAGTDLVRLGTDRIQYRYGDPVSIRARLGAPQLRPGDGVEAIVYDGDKVIRRVPLTATPEGGGLLQGELRDLVKAGKYRIELAGVSVEEALAAERKSNTKVSTEIVVGSTAASHEAADLAADAMLPTQLAAATGGKVVTPERVDELFQVLGPKSSFERERRIVPLWNFWPVLLAYLTAVNLEWILRRSRGMV